MSNGLKYSTLGECKAAIRSEQFAESPDTRLEFFDFFFSDATAQWRTPIAKDASSSLSSSTTSSLLSSVPAAAPGTVGSLLGPVEYRVHYGYISPVIPTLPSAHTPGSGKGRGRSDSMVRSSAVGSGEEWLEIALVGVQDPWSFIRSTATKYVARDFFAASGYSSIALSQILSAWSKADAWYKKAGLLTLLQMAVFDVKDLNTQTTSSCLSQSESFADVNKEMSSSTATATTTTTPIIGRSAAQNTPTKKPSISFQPAPAAKTPMKSYLRPTARSEAAAVSASPKAPPTPVQYRRVSSTAKIGSGNSVGMNSSTGLPYQVGTTPTAASAAAGRTRGGVPGASVESSSAKPSAELAPSRIGWPEQAMSQLVSVVAVPSLQHEQLPVREAAIDFLVSTAKHFTRLRSFIIDYISRTVVTYNHGNGDGTTPKKSNSEVQRPSKAMSSSLTHHNARIPTPSSDSGQYRTTQGSQDTSDRDNDVCSTSETDLMSKSTGARVSFLIDGCTCSPVSISTSLHALEGCLRCASRMSEYFLPLLEMRRNPFRIAILTLASHPAAVVRQQIAELWSADSAHGLDNILTVFADSLPENDDDHRLRNFSLSTVPTEFTFTMDRSAEDKSWRLRETVLMAMSVMLAKRCRGDSQLTMSAPLSESQDANSLLRRTSDTTALKASRDIQSDDKPHVPMSKWPQDSQAQLLVRALACATSFQYEVSRMGKQVLPLVTQYVVRNARPTLPFLQTTLELLYSSAQFTTLGSLDEVAPRTVPALFAWIVWFSSIRLTLNSADELSLAAAIANISPMRRLKHWKTVTLKAVSADAESNGKSNEVDEELKRPAAGDGKKKARVVLPSPTAAPVSVAEKKSLLSIPMPACDLAAAVIVFATYFPSCPRYIASVSSKVETWEIALRIDPEAIKYAADFAATSLARPRRSGHLSSVMPNTTNNNNNNNGGSDGEEDSRLLANIINRTSTLHLIPTWLQGLEEMETHQQCLALSAVSISLRELYTQPPVRKSVVRGAESSKVSRTRHMDPDALRSRSSIPSITIGDAPVTAERLSITASPDGTHNLFQFGYVSHFVAPSLQDGGDGAAQGFEWLKSVHPTTCTLPHVDLVQATGDAGAQKSAEDGSSYFTDLKRIIVSHIKFRLFFNATTEPLYLQRGVEPCVMHFLRHLLTDMVAGALIEITHGIAVVIARLDRHYPQWMNFVESRTSRSPSLQANTPWNHTGTSHKSTEEKKVTASDSWDDDWDDDDDGEDTSDDDNEGKVAGANVATEMISAHTLLKFWCTTHFNGSTERMISSVSQHMSDSSEFSFENALLDSDALQEKVRFILQFRSSTDE